jgi:hypothetical protein
MGILGITASLPSFNTFTALPSERIPAVVVVLLMAFFPVVFALIDALHGERIAKGLDRLMEGDTVIAPVGSRLVLVPFKIGGQRTTEYQ